MLVGTLALFGSLSALFGQGLGAAIPQKREKVCNGYAELCDRSYGNITFLGAHDSFAASKNPLDLAADQNVGIADQLKLGVRMLQAQSHINDEDGAIHFCHTDCLLFDGGKVVDYLKTVKTFMDANPNEVLTLIFTNPENLDMKEVWEPAFVDSGIANMSFVPPKPGTPIKQADWPTLGEMIADGKRVVTFLDQGADSGVVPYLMPEFKMIWEPPFSVTDPNFPCKIDRITGPLKPEEHMYMLNHNFNKKLLGIGALLTPDRKDAKKTNGIASILANANGCTKLGGGRAPNFVMLDFVDVGEGLKAVNQLNGLA